MSYAFYHFLHLAALISLFLALGGMLFGSYNKKQMILHGIASLVLFITGFGLIARLQISMVQMWLLGKLGIWFVLSALIPILISKKVLKKYLWLIVLISGICACWLVTYK